MSDHLVTRTIHYEDEEAVITAVCACGWTDTVRGEDEPGRDNDSWDNVTSHLGYDPREVPTGFENTSQTD